MGWKNGKNRFLMRGCTVFFFFHCDMTKRGKIQMTSVELLCYSATRPKLDQILKTLVKHTFGGAAIFTTCIRCNTSDVSWKDDFDKFLPQQNICVVSVDLLPEIK